MDNVDKKPEDDAPGDEIESPVDGPTPDWMRLATSAGSSGSSLTEENTPAWLKSIRAGQGLSKESKSPEANPATEPTASQAAADNSMSDLERLLAEEGIDLGSVAEERPEGAEDMSARDWLIATSSEEMIRNKLGAEPIEEKPATPKSISAVSDDDNMSDLERLLAEEGIDLGSVAEERPEGSEDMSARDWLISTSSEEIIRNKLGTRPLEEKSAPPAAAPQPGITDSDDKMVVEEDLPDWLQDIAAEAGEPEPSFALETSTAAVSVPAVEDDQIVVEDELPDWLQEIADESPAAAAPDDLIVTPPAPVIARSASSPPDEDKMVVEEDLPDWLQEIAAEAPIASEPELALPDFSDLSTTARVIPDAVDEDKMVVEEDLPDWLQEISDESSAAPEAEPASLDLPPAPAAPVIARRPGTAPLNPDKMVVTEDLPDWLQEIAEEPTVAGDLEATDFVEMPAIPSVPPVPVAEDKTVNEEELPDWLQEAAAEETLPIVEPELTTPLSSSSADKMIIEEDLPDWLREVEVGNTEPSLAFEEADLNVAPTALDEIDSDEDLPDWLREVEVSSLENNLLMPPLEAPTELPAEPLLSPTLSSEDEFDSLDDEEDLPDWLREVQERDGRDTAGAVARPLPAASEPASPTTGLTGEEELPDWLREVQEEPEPLAFEELETVAATDEAIPEVIQNEDLPDWLREVEFDEEEPFEPSEPSPEPLAEVVAEQTLIIADELPDWLQEAQDEMPEEAIAELETPEPATVTAPVSDSPVHLVDEAGLPDWLRDVEEEPEALVEEEPAPLPEPVTMASIEPESSVPVPVEEADEEVVEVVEVIPEPIPPVLETAPVVVSTTSGDIPDWLQKLREVDTEEQQAPAPAPVFARKAAPQPVLAQAITEPEPELPADAEERLKLARTARNKGEIDEAVRIYDSLISRGVYLDKIIDDMQQSVKAHPTNYLLFQVMGDAMMKDGRLQSALNAYREALSKL